MSILSREPKTSASRTFDLIIIGGGIYGAMLTYEASCRGLRTLLIERDDFGENTSFNSLRIIHGGFRFPGKNRHKLFYDNSFSKFLIFSR